jgi:tetratricopeptide (TPR) repeat protein
MTIMVMVDFLSIVSKFILALALGLFLGSSTLAQSSDEQKISPDQKSGETEESSQNAIPNNVVSLDDLFAQLKKETDSVKARGIEKKIWYRWTQSGSETVDLLMGWTSVAMKKKNWAAAFDLLDQIVVLAPQFAEGWNRRATLYFLRGQYGRSIHDIEQVLKLESRHFGAMAGMGSILLKLNKSIENDKRALAMWHSVLALYPANKNAQKSVIKLEEKLSGRGI